MHNEEKKAEKANNDIEADTDNKIFKKITKTHRDGLKALEREVFIEGLIKNDEEKNQKEQTSVISTQIDVEKKKKKAINKQLFEKELEQEFQMSEMSAEKDIKDAKKEIQVQIEVNRDQLKNAIEQIRKEAKRSRDTMQAKLKQLKTKISKKVMQASKTGDKTQCLAGLRADDIRMTYCNGAYFDDYLENDYCKNVDNFCYSCCDNEYGLLKPSERDDCYDSCDKERDKIDKENEQKAEGPPKANQWQWSATEKPKA